MIPKGFARGRGRERRAAEFSHGTIERDQGKDGVTNRDEREKRDGERQRQREERVKRLIRRKETQKIFGQ
jgi:hypothetical protein